MGRAKSKRLKDFMRNCDFEHRIVKRKPINQLIKEKDTARGIIKDLCQRDCVTGEITYSHSKDPAIRQALAEGYFCTETERMVPSSNDRKKKRVVEKIWHKMDVDFDEFTLEQGEVLNRGYSPCWWR